jgi:hypothetical protein
MTENESSALVVDAADPRSLANILPTCLAEKVREIPYEMMIQDELTLSTLVNPTDQQKRIKIQFWDEYEEAMKQKRPLALSNIVFGVCSKEYFLEFIRIQRNVAWLISPRPSYKVRVAELIEKGLNKVDAIFDIAMTDKNQVSVGQLYLAALRMLDMRKHGGYTQRIEQKSLQLNKNLDHNPGDKGPAITGEGSVEELETQIRELEKKVAAGKNQNGALLDGPHSEVIDVTPRTVHGSKEPTSSEV